MDEFCFTISGTSSQLRKASQEPGEKKNSAAIHKTCGDLEVWLTKTDKYGLPGHFKAWIFQHARVLWPLLLYEVPMSKVEALEKKISSYLWWWLGLPRSLSNVALYGSSNSPLAASRRSLW